MVLISCTLAEKSIAGCRCRRAIVMPILLKSRLNREIKLNAKLLEESSLPRMVSKTPNRIACRGPTLVLNVNICPRKEHHALTLVQRRPQYRSEAPRTAHVRYGHHVRTQKMSPFPAGPSDHSISVMNLSFMIFSHKNPSFHPPRLCIRLVLLAPVNLGPV